MTKKIIGRLCIIIALLVILYPFISRHQLSSMNKELAHNYYKTDVTEEEKKTKEDAKEEYNTSLLYGAFNAQGEVASLKLPKSKLLSKELEPIGVLYIPRIEEDIPVYMGTTDDVLTIGVGIVENTSIPGGVGTNSVISGHRGTHNGNFFLHLDDMEIGDDIYYVSDGEILKYTVYETDIVQPDEASKLEIDPLKDKMTLLTCTPYLINTERLLIYGERAELTEEDRELFVDKFSDEKKDDVDIKAMEQRGKIKVAITMGVSFVILATAFILVPVMLNRKKEDKAEEDN